MDCKKCIYLIRRSKRVDEQRCSKFKGEISEPCFCKYYKTEKQYIKEQVKKAK